MPDAAYCDEECSRLQWQMKLTSLKLKKKAFLPALVQNKFFKTDRCNC